MVAEEDILRLRATRKDWRRLHNEELYDLKRLKKIYSVDKIKLVMMGGECGTCEGKEIDIGL